jgi:hypothetical protein
MTTKRTPITKRVIAKILGRRVEGWNDKSKLTNRIKLTEVLTYREMSMLESELTFMFPEYRFAIGNICWRPQQRGRVMATAITFWK